MSTKESAYQRQGTKEFDEAIAGRGPAMPQKKTDGEEDAALTEALMETFPASDPVAAASADLTAGKPPRKAGAGGT